MRVIKSCFEGVSEMSEKSAAFVSQVAGVVARFEKTLTKHEWISRRDSKRMRDEACEVFTIPSLMLL